MTELDLHRAVAAYLGAALAPTVWWTTFPAGGGGAVRGGILKGIGLKPGVPDIVICDRGRVFWIELKSANGRLSGDQVSCHADLRAVGCAVGVARSLSDVSQLLALWGIPVRGRIAA